MDKEHARRQKRRHSEAFKAAVVEACREPGASVAGVALAHGVNANLVRKWLAARGVVPPRRRQQAAVVPETLPLPPPSEFVPLHLAAEPTPPAPAAIRIELRRGGTTVQIHWPVEAAGACGTWLREWLR